MRLLIAAVLAIGLAETPSAQGPPQEDWRGSPWHSLRDPSAPTWYGGVWKNWAETFEEGATSVMVPVSTFYLRFAYPPERISEFTEWPLGVGLGRTRMDDRSSRTVFAMVFQDSLGSPQYQLGYVWLRNRRPVAARRDLTLGLGYTLSLMVRRNFHYIPIPVVLPVASIGFKRLSVGTTYIPGGKGFGNLLVTGAHLSF